MPLSDDDVREILRIIDESELQELHVKTRGFDLHLRRASDEGTTPPPVKTDGLVETIASPMLGMFYRAEGPGKDPFVQIGSRVEPDTTVCIIEVMKMMNSVPAGVAGTVVEVCREEGELVEDGAPLFKVKP